jgi:hypothetical protein
MFMDVPPDPPGFSGQSECQGHLRDLTSRYPPLINAASSRYWLAAESPIYDAVEWQ